MTRLFHLVPADQWRTWETRDEYAPASLQGEGFVHLSTAEQVPGTLATFFAGVPDVLLLEVEVPDDEERLRWEPAEGPRGVEEFPHLHRPLPTAWVVSASTVRSGFEPLGPAS